MNRIIKRKPVIKANSIPGIIKYFTNTPTVLEQSDNGLTDLYHDFVSVLSSYVDRTSSTIFRSYQTLKPTIRQKEAINGYVRKYILSKVYPL